MFQVLHKKSVLSLVIFCNQYIIPFAILSALNGGFWGKKRHVDLLYVVRVNYFC